MSSQMKAPLLKVALWAYLLALMSIVWTPVSSDSGALLGLFRIEGPLERILNLLLLTPLPFLLIKNFGNLSKFLLLFSGPLVSITIEAVQNFIPGRVSDPIDIVLNSLGYTALVALQARK
jgi:glycopeptide antibiotics resistance protein